MKFYRIPLLVISFFALTLAQPAVAQQNDHPFEAEIQAFEQADAKQNPPRNAILFVGSSSIRMWKSLQEDFPDQEVINRGFGGSQFSDLLYYMDRIVLPYQPRQIFVYEGDNDIFAGVSASTVLRRFKLFVTQIQENLPGTEVVFISIKPSPSRKNVYEQMKRANMLIKSYAMLHHEVGYVDIFNPMLNSTGEIRSDIFKDDNLHMNAKGYDIWQRTIKPYLD